MCVCVVFPNAGNNINREGMVPHSKNNRRAETNKWFKSLKNTHNYNTSFFTIIIIIITVTQLALACPPLPLMSREGERGCFGTSYPELGNHYSTSRRPFHLSCLICSTGPPPPPQPSLLSTAFAFIVIIVVGVIVLVVTVPDSPPPPPAASPFSRFICLRTGSS